MIQSVGIGIALALIGIGVLAMLFSGVKSVINGKQDFKKIGSVLIPFVVFGIAYAVTQDFAQAGIATMLFMIAVMVLLIAYTGLRTTFKF